MKGSCRFFGCVSPLLVSVDSSQPLSFPAPPVFWSDHDVPVVPVGDIPVVPVGDIPVVPVVVPVGHVQVELLPREDVDDNSTGPCRDSEESRDA